MSGINFNSNNYGITKNEWKAIKKELKAADKKNDNFELTKTDYKAIETAIAKGDLAAYLDKAGDDLKLAMGLALTGKVDGTENLEETKAIVSNLDADCDKNKVLNYIIQANKTKTPENVETAYNNFGISFGNILKSNPDNYLVFAGKYANTQEIEKNLQHGFMAEAFA